jgi:uncharacterized protein (UPF0548 family)
MFSLRRPSPADLAHVASRQADCELTYAERGASDGLRPAGYQNDRWETDLGGFEQATFDRLGEAVCQWQAQRGAGVTVYPAQAARPGLTFALSFRLAGVYVTAGARVVYLTSEPGRRGFAYGTLPQHPEQGEEAFHIVRDGSRMLFRITAFSRPAHPLARAGAPITRLAQVRMTKAYLGAMRAAAASLSS